jgi:RNA polymerase sigma factor (sigma-70 family)
MDQPLSVISMTEQDRQISEVVAEQRSRLRNFIRRRVPDPSDAEDIVQEVFYELVEANRLLMPIDHVTGWLFRVARNRITDLFRKKKPETFSGRAAEDEDGELLRIEDLLPSPDAGPEALYFRSVLLDELELANCPMNSVKYSSLTNSKDAASKSCRQKPASASTPCSRASATRCFICANDCRAFTTILKKNDAKK